MQLPKWHETCWSTPGVFSQMYNRFFNKGPRRVSGIVSNYNKGNISCLGYTICRHITPYNAHLSIWRFIGSFFLNILLVFFNFKWFLFKEHQ